MNNEELACSNDEIVLYVLNWDE